MRMTKHWPLLVFFTFFALLVGINLYYSPSWGLMDDSQNLERAKGVWQSGNPLLALWGTITGTLSGWGIFWPVYYTWVIFVYHIFKDSPLSIYILITVLNFISLFLWGLVLHKIFSAPKNNFFLNVFLFPVIFFIFTPFWNIFMYISVQQKFVLFFSALSLYFLGKAYNLEKNKLLIFSFLALLAGILSHPEGIYLSIAYIVFSVLDAAFFKYKKKISLVNLAIHSIFFLVYYVFTVKIQMQGVYTAKYKNNLNIANLAGIFAETSLIIKLFFIMAFIVFVYMFIKIIRRKNVFSPPAIIIPLGIMAYLSVMLPWGFPNYHLSCLTPYLIGLFFPVYLWLCRRKFPSIAVNVFIIPILVLTAFFYIGIPRIQKISEIKHVESFIKELVVKSPRSYYFMPPPCAEATGAIKYFTGANTTYLGGGKLSGEFLNSSYQNYLITRDECPAVSLEQVKVVEEIYRSNTWRIVRVSGEKDYNAAYKADFPENIFRKIITYLRSKV